MYPWFVSLTCSKLFSTTQVKSNFPSTLHWHPWLDKNTTTPLQIPNYNPNMPLSLPGITLHSQVHWFSHSPGQYAFFPLPNSPNPFPLSLIFADKHFLLNEKCQSNEKQNSTGPSHHTYLQHLHHVLAACLPVATIFLSMLPLKTSVSSYAVRFHFLLSNMINSAFYWIIPFKYFSHIKTK